MSQKNISIFGSSPDTGNLGVSALCYSVIYKLSEQFNDLKICDYSKGIREDVISFPNKEVSVKKFGAYLSKKVYKAESTFRINFALKSGLLKSDSSNAILDSDVFLDISGGDSYTDLYGTKRYNLINAYKQMAIQQNKPLILMPQTYGPFKSQEVIQDVKRTLSSAKYIWARDERSYNYLIDLMGNDFDSNKFLLGYDVAFSLPKLDCSPHLSEDIKTLFEQKEAPVIGINVSGLLFHHPEESKEKFSLTINYKNWILRVIENFLNKTEAKILLISHVSSSLKYEDDHEACLGIQNSLNTNLQKRVFIAPYINHPCSLKDLISKCDWFTGSRMHACIAALTTATPVMSAAYSSKTLGIFEHFDLAEQVLDLRTNEASKIDLLLESFQQRHVIKETLEKNLPLVQNKVEDMWGKLNQQILSC